MVVLPLLAIVGLAVLSGLLQVQRVARVVFKLGLVGLVIFVGYVAWRYGWVSLECEAAFALGAAVMGVIAWWA